MEFVLITFYSIMIVIAFTWATSKMIFWLWWMMGSPASDGVIATCARGRIFSKIGQKICDRYNRFEVKESQRLQELMEGVNGNAQKMSEIIDSKKINPYKAFGVCVICFGTHFSYITSIVLLILFHTSIQSLQWYVFLLVFAYYWVLTLAFLQDVVKKHFE
jgi:hypothetical protein